MLAMITQRQPVENTLGRSQLHCSLWMQSEQHVSLNSNVGSDIRDSVARSRSGRA
jgi:hypothetical protein